MSLTISGIQSSDGTIKVKGGGATVDLSVVGGGGGFTPGGDLAGTSSNQTVIGIQTVSVSASTPVNGEALILTGGVWTPTAIPLGISPGTGIGVAAASGIYTISNTGVVSFNTRTGAVTSQLSDVGGLFSAQGDLIVGSGSGTGVLLSEGTTGQVLTVKSDGSLYWTTPSAGGVTSVTANDTSVVVSPTTGAVKINTNTLDVIATDHPPAANWSNNSKKITSLANGTAAQDAAAFGQIPTSVTPTTGWIPDSNTWTYSSLGTSSHTSILTVNADLTGVIGLGDRIKLTDVSTLYFIVTAISVLSGTTTITLYGGATAPTLNASYAHAGGAVTSITVLALTHSVPSGAPIIFANGDTATTTASAAQGATTISIGSTTPTTTNGGWFSGQTINAGKYKLSGGTITNPFYSHAKSPFGFNADPSRWTEQISDNQLYGQTSPVNGTFYSATLGGTSLLLPIGAWRLYFELVAFAVGAASATQANIQAVLSTSSSSQSDPELAGFSLTGISPGPTTNTLAFGTFHREKHVALAAAATYYLIGRTTTAQTQTSITFAGSDGNTVVRAVCAYL